MQDAAHASNSPVPAPGRGFEWLLRALLYLCAFNLFSYLTADPDLWGHLRFGELTWNNGGVVATDPYSFTAAGHPWINHEWLTEVLFFLIYAAAGSTGLLLFKGGVGVWVVHALTSLYLERSRQVVLFAAFALLALPVMAPGFMTRPHVMTFLFLTLMWMVLQRGLNGRPRLLWWAPPIFALWANCHGGVVAGLGIFGVATLIEGGRLFFNRDPVWKTLAGSFGVSCLAVLINPYGWDLWRFFIYTLGTPRDISEWQGVTLAGAAHLQFKILAGLFALSLLLPVKKRGWEVAVIVIALAFGFKHQRHTVLGAILLCPYLPLMFAQWQPRWDILPRFYRAHSDFRMCVAAVGVAALALLSIQVYGKHKPMDFQISVDPRMYPTHLAQFLEVNGIDGNLLTPFDWGEYFIWKRSQSRVAVDGRFRTVYPENVLRQASAFAAGQPGFDAMLDAHPVRFVITAHDEPVDQAMEKIFGWVKIYQDPISKLFVRAGDPLAEQFRAGALVLPEDPPADLFPG